jgi:antirestriction protein ArdC
VKEIISERIIKKLESGVAPWKQPWKPGLATGPVNWNTGRPYRGINRWLLGEDEWCTFNGCRQGGGVWPGNSKAEKAVLYKPLGPKKATCEHPEEEDEEETGKKKARFMIRYFNVARACDCGLNPRKREGFSLEPHQRIERAEAVRDRYLAIGPGFTEHQKDGAYYSLLEDRVYVPLLGLFKTPESYYSTVFHELAHSTGAKSRLDRGLTGNFFSEKYGKEELVAEMTAAMLMWHCGIAYDNVLNSSTSYIDHWISAIKKDSNMVLWAGAKAQKAYDLILGKDDEGHE